jgi:hypothetical protein
MTYLTYITPDQNSAPTRFGRPLSSTSKARQRLERIQKDLAYGEVRERLPNGKERLLAILTNDGRWMSAV